MKYRNINNEEIKLVMMPLPEALTKTTNISLIFFSSNKKHHSLPQWNDRADVVIMWVM
jgi:hypothetical protein